MNFRGRIDRDGIALCLPINFVLIVITKSLKFVVKNVRF